MLELVIDVIQIGIEYKDEMDGKGGDNAQKPNYFQCGAPNNYCPTNLNCPKC